MKIVVDRAKQPAIMVAVKEETMDAQDCKELKKATKRVNDQLYNLGLQYWNYLPIFEIDSILVEFGFDATEPAIYCGREGNTHEPVGDGKFLSMTWHKMESGRYEIVAYLN